MVQLPHYYDSYLINSAGNRLSFNSTNLPYFKFLARNSPSGSRDVRVSGNHNLTINNSSDSSINVNAVVNNQGFTIPLNLIHTNLKIDIDLNHKIIINKTTSIKVIVTNNGMTIILILLLKLIYQRPLSLI